MRLSQLGLCLVWLMSTGCASSGSGAAYGTGGSGATGGTGGASSTESNGGSTASTGTGGSVGTGGVGGGSGGAAPCDAIGECGNMGRGCVACAIESACAAELSGCFDNDDCGAYGGCVDACAGEMACIDACGVDFPDGKGLFDAYYQCVLCDQCVASCAMVAICAM